MQKPSAASLVTARRDHGWVTKTDVTTYVRCPYTYSLLWRGEIVRDEILDEATRELVAEGVAFHEQVDASVPPVEVGSPEEVQALFASGVTLYHTPIYQNLDLKILGQPDGIDPAGGLMVPIEFKMHKDVSVLDELELAFYWLLLTPQRTLEDEPRGIVVLRREGMPVSVDVIIAPNRIKRVVELLAKVRAARKERVAPRICGCNVCTKVRREEVRPYAAEHKDLTMLAGIARSVAEALEAVGVTDYEDLAGRDPEELVEQVRRVRCEVLFRTGAALADSRRCLSTRLRPVLRRFAPGRRGVHRPGLGVPNASLRRDALPRGRQGSDRRPGSRLSVPRRRHDPCLRELAVAYLAEVLGAHRELPVVTWNGRGADCPFLRKAAARCGMTDPMHGRRHEDIYWYATKSLRLPTPSTKLKELADYFAIPRLDDVGGGLHAQLLFRQLLATTDLGHRQRLEDDLLHYNQDDLSVLVGITDELRGDECRVIADVAPSAPARAGRGLQAPAHG